MPEGVVPRNEGEPNLTVQVHQKLLKDYFNTGEAVDHSIMVPCYSQCSNQRVKRQGFTEVLPKANIKFSMSFIIQQCNKSVTNACDDPPCQQG